MRLVAVASLLVLSGCATAHVTQWQRSTGLVTIAAPLYYGATNPSGAEHAAAWTRAREACGGIPATLVDEGIREAQPGRLTSFVAGVAVSQSYDQTEYFWSYRCTAPDEEPEAVAAASESRGGSISLSNEPPPYVPPRQRTIFNP